MRQVQLLSKAVTYMANKVKYITEQSKLKHVTTRVASRKRAADNLENRYEKMAKNQFKPNYYYLHEDDIILASIIKEPSDQPLLATLPWKLANTNCNNKKDIILNYIPKNGSQFSLLEAFQLMDTEDITPDLFYKTASITKVRSDKPKLMCHRATFYRRWKKYISENVKPSPNDYCITMLPAF